MVYQCKSYYPYGVSVYVIYRYTHIRSTDAKFIRIGQRLGRGPGVATVWVRNEDLPGLPSYLGMDVAVEQMGGWGGRLDDALHC